MQKKQESKLFFKYDDKDERYDDVIYKLRNPGLVIMIMNTKIRVKIKKKVILIYLKLNKTIILDKVVKF
jgi:hypothetical protein